MTKRILCLIFAAALFLASCDSSAPEVSDTPTTSPAPTEAASPSPTPLTKNYYLTRQLSVTEMDELKGCDMETARERICTVADAVAWLDGFGWDMYTGNDGMERNYSVDYLKEITGRPHATGGIYTGFTAYLLSDDYPDMQILTAGYLDEARMLNGVVLPTDTGYLITSPAAYSLWASRSTLMTIERTEVATLDRIEEAIEPINLHNGLDLKLLTQIFLAPAAQDDLTFEYLNGKYSLATGEATEVYTIPDQELAVYIEERRLELVEKNRGNLEKNMPTYGMPDAFYPTLTWEEAVALHGEDMATVAEALETLGDCLMFYAASGFTYEPEGDIELRDGDKQAAWHFNYYPEAALKRNMFDCGSAAALTMELLKDNYDIGLVDLGFELGEGGHVVNWLAYGGKYYTFDTNSCTTSGFHAGGLNFSEKDTLEEAALAYADKIISAYTTKTLMVYQPDYGDAICYFVENDKIRYQCVDDCKDTAEIIKETPEEGYVYQWVELPDDIRETIHQMRSGE